MDTPSNCVLYKVDKINSFLVYIQSSESSDQSNPLDAPSQASRHGCLDTYSIIYQGVFSTRKKGKQQVRNDGGKYERDKVENNI